MTIPIIDIFAGPGGLGEGFSAYINPENGEREFKIALSIEKEKHAHQTLLLRSFYRQFPQEEIPKEYYDFVRGDITKDQMIHEWQEKYAYAEKEAWNAQLGENDNATPNEEVDQRIEEALNGAEDWLLIGGPPCQAYSVVGRSRRQEKTLNEEKDQRVGLYKQYLRILAVHNPTVFVMENVKGLLSAKTESNPIFSNILADLADPVQAYNSEYESNGKRLECPGYKIYSLVVKPRNDDWLNPDYNQQDFIIEAEKHGIPQTRHRVILLGIRKGLDIEPEILTEEPKVNVEHVLQGLPKIRSGVSKAADSDENWIEILKNFPANRSFKQIDEDVQKEINNQLCQLEKFQNVTGGSYVPDDKISIQHDEPEWFLNSDLKGALNHESRTHMASDIHRYFFISCFAKAKGRSPKLNDFPEGFLPDHKNVQAGINEKKFADRFTVQLWNKPCKTITSHISKDGHYYIHPDPKQCRSFTVREAARVQTFPDDYFFCGPKTAQFNQVGNAVPPLLANKIADSVKKAFDKIQDKKPYFESSYSKKYLKKPRLLS